MSSVIDLDMLKAFGQIAAPAGIAIGAFLYLGRDIVARNIFPTLTRQHAYHVIIALAFMAWTVALAGIGAWTYVSTHQGRAGEDSRESKSNLPPLPGDTGWIFAGYFDIAKEVFIEGPYVSVQSTVTRGHRRFVEVGDTVALKVARDVHIVDYKRQGAAQKLVPPITKGIIDEYDKTGVRLPAGTELIVRDVSEGKWPDSPNGALWLRVVYVPK
ncbi:hypothetical protein JJB11_09620 [Ramlibacter ginsenosidimutans]|uniref:Uncharacterized protein n=1 Tax=Ramlibacter ginsenosidimutans TaxID=502333 RepID=A0A934WMC1_9BURK|nr:hypothetical protein [Ramlibacter ginsenosidimutans]MBK6006348.1 hypothetical protein [Ramlibacter ginsenosidimutans]